MNSNMYKDAITWSPYKGCKFGCVYCLPSFQLQAKRQKQRCMDCYDFVPHIHPDRLNKIPSAEIIFVCGNGDLSFCDPNYVREIIDAIIHHNIRNPCKIYYLQSKRPEYFTQFLAELPENVILVTTLETNRDNGYETISQAPVPSDRYEQFMNLKYWRKVVTVEPVMDFDVDIFSRRIINLRPEYVWLGFNSRPKQIKLPEPSEDKIRSFVSILRQSGIEIRFKKMRGMEL